MTRPDETTPDAEDRIDDLVRAATARETDDAMIFARVIEKIDAEDRPQQSLWRLPDISIGAAASAFAAMLVASGLAGYELTGAAEADLLLIAFGEPSVLTDPLFGSAPGSGQ